MKIDKQFLEDQIVSFENQRAEFQKGADLASGGIQACEHLLKVLKMKKPKEEEIPDRDQKEDDLSELEAVLPEGTEIVKDKDGKPVTRTNK